MAEGWRVPFARFLKENRAVEPGRARFYLYWVDRCLAPASPGEAALASGTVSRFIEQLGRDEEPGHVQQEEEAISRSCWDTRTCRRP